MANSTYLTEQVSNENRSVIDSYFNASQNSQQTYLTELEESDDGLNDLSDLLSPLNAEVIERELTELASSANGAFHDITVSELVSAIDGPLIGLSPIQCSPPKLALFKCSNSNPNESPLSLFHPSILKRRQTMVDYQTPPSMKKTRLNACTLFNENQFVSNSSTPFTAQTQSNQSNDLKCLPFSPTQV